MASEALRVPSHGSRKVDTWPWWHQGQSGVALMDMFKKMVMHFHVCLLSMTNGTNLLSIVMILSFL